MCACKRIHNTQVFDLLYGESVARCYHETRMEYVIQISKMTTNYTMTNLLVFVIKILFIARFCFFQLFNDW